MAGEDATGEEDDSKAEKRMKTSLLSVLREQFEKDELANADVSRGPSSSVSTPRGDHMEVEA